MLKYGYLNGRFLPVPELMLPWHNLGLQFGLGLFETLKVFEGRPIWLPEHIDRLNQGLETLAIPPIEDGSIGQAVQQLISLNQLDEGSVKIIVTAPHDNEKEQAAVLITGKRGEIYSAKMYIEGFALKTVLRYRRNPYSPLSQVKSLNFAENALARREALAEGADEGLLLNVHGYVAEGTVSNLFWHDGYNLNTPAASAGLLAGIARGKVIKAAAELRLPLQQVLAHLNDVQSAREVFITNSLMGVMPVTTIDGQTVADGRTGPVTLALMKQINWVNNDI